MSTTSSALCTHDAPSGFVPGPMPQIRAQRERLGVRGWDNGRTFDGGTLVTPSLGGDRAYLVDMRGEVLHSWQLPYPPGLDSWITPDGTLFHTGKIPDGRNHFCSRQPWKGGWAGELSWSGEVLWSVEHPDAHHSAAQLQNGNIMLIILEPVPEEIARRVQGGMPGSEWQGQMFADALVEMTKDGELVRTLHLWHHLDPDIDRIVAAQDARNEWTHCNFVEELPDGDLLVSYRHTCSIAIVGRSTGRPRWTMRSPQIAQQHAPTLLDNGNILLFDNGTHRPDHPLSFSRILEIDPSTSETVWSYQDRSLLDFYSPLTANAQRLPNGNTLITEATYGRIFEVTREGTIVWEYVNPFFVDPVHDPSLPATNRLFRSYRYGQDEIERWSAGSRG